MYAVKACGSPGCNKNTLHLVLWFPGLLRAVFGCQETDLLCVLVQQDIPGYLRQILRSYAALFAVLIVFTETEVERFLAYFAVFESWMCRAMFQFFVAVLTLYTTRMKDEGEGETDFQKSLQLCAPWVNLPA